MKKLILAFVLFASPALAQDGIDLCQAVYHSSPNICQWPITVTLETVEFKPGTAADGNTVGVRPIFDRQQMNAVWPDVRPVGWEGTIQFTLWACIKADVWHCAGLQEFWSDRNGPPRIWSGAPILTQWHDWVYRGQWGAEMERYRPTLGDEIVFGLIAGDRRLMDLGVQERSNFVRVPLMAVGVAVPLGTVQTPPQPPQGPPATPGPPVISTGILKAIEARILAVEQQQVEAGIDLNTYKQDVGHAIDLVMDTRTRLEALEAAYSRMSCKASAFGVGIRCEIVK